MCCVCREQLKRGGKKKRLFLFAWIRRPIIREEEEVCQIPFHIFVKFSQSVKDHHMPSSELRERGEIEEVLTSQAGNFIFFVLFWHNDTRFLLSPAKHYTHSHTHKKRNNRNSNTHTTCEKTIRGDTHHWIASLSSRLFLFFGWRAKILIWLGFCLFCTRQNISSLFF